MTDRPLSLTSAIRWLTLQRIRTIAVIAALGSVTVGAMVFLVMLVSIYPSLRVTLHNLERISAATAISAENLADVSDEIALDMVETSDNLNAAAANLEEATANFELNSLNDNLVRAVTQLLKQQEQISRR